MQFIYFGEATIKETRMRQFISLAKFLKIKELRRKTSIEADESIADIFPKESEIEDMKMFYFFKVCFFIPDIFYFRKCSSSGKIVFIDHFN